MINITDITQQNELKESFSHAQRMQTIGYLVGSVAHDFNNILTAVTGFCDLLLMRHTVGDPSFAHIIQIKQSADRASNLVKRLLAFSRKQTLKLQFVNLNELFNDFATLIQRLVGNDIVFSQKIHSDIWLVKIDPVQMEQVILNLAVNAHQAMKQGDKLTIKAYNTTLKNLDPYLTEFTAPSGETLPPAGEYVAIEVEDTGCGIPHNILRQIFEPFFTTKTDKSGTGLGLSTVYGIIRQSDGYVYVKSKEGAGTTFLIYLKRQQYSQEDIEETRLLEKEIITSQSSIRKDLSGKGVIALIEDEESIRLFAKSALTNKGYEVIEFSSAKHALENIRTDLGRIDLIISDVIMPEISGPAMVKELRKIKPALKIIFISGYGEEAFTKEYGESRDFDFIPKPFTLKQLASKVKEVIERE
jgi:two-component system cell cycle sensor histidine kinase/response regulator CckA